MRTLSVAGIVAVCAAYALVIVGLCVRLTDPAARQAASLERDVCAPFVIVEATETPCHGAAFGCGTMIEHRGRVYVLTAKHVPGPDGKVKLIRYSHARDGEERCAGVVVYRSELRDLCLIEPEISPAGPVATVADDDSSLGEDLWYIGAPNGVYGSVEKTIANHRPDSSLRRDRINGNGTFGSSGGGVFLHRGGRFVLIGVVSCFCSRASGPIYYEKSLPSFLAEYDP